MTEGSSEEALNPGGGLGSLPGGVDNLHGLPEMSRCYSGVGVGVLWAEETLRQRQGSECVTRGREFLESRGQGGECRGTAGERAGRTEEDLEGSSQGLGLVL